MQLPTWTFRKVIKNKRLGSIIEELEQEHFSGACTFLSGGTRGTIVLAAGICILAEFQDRAGAAALEELQKAKGLCADAALFTLDDAGIQLTLWSNRISHTALTEKNALTIPVSVNDEKEIPEDATPKEIPSAVSSFEEDIETFESMDIDNVTDRIRSDCKTIIRQLHLEHLMER
jgi:hypothetical protein